MTQGLTADQLASLHRSHAMYGDIGQEERSDCRRMAELGHPKALQYRQLRGFFDTLLYACNHGARFYSFRSERENSQFWRPGLTLSWYPNGLGFGHVYPAHERWEDYVEAAAAANWVGAGPALDAPSWHIHTDNDDLRSAVRSEVRMLGLELGAGGGNGMVVYVKDFSQSEAIRKAICVHHTPLQPRTSEADKADQMALPLAKKRFMLGNVDALTVTDRHVLVPLIAIGDVEGLQRAAVGVLDLLRQGFRFSEADEWLSKTLTAAAYARAKARFGGAATASVERAGVGG